MFFICLDITEISLEYNSAICDYVNHTVSSLGLTFTSKEKSPSLNFIISYLLIVFTPRIYTYRYIRDY